MTREGMFNLDYFFSLPLLLYMLNQIENPNVWTVRQWTSCPKTVAAKLLLIWKMESCLQKTVLFNNTIQPFQFKESCAYSAQPKKQTQNILLYNLHQFNPSVTISPTLVCHNDCWSCWYSLANAAGLQLRAVTRWEVSYSIVMGYVFLKRSSQKSRRVEVIPGVYFKKDSNSSKITMKSDPHTYPNISILNTSNHCTDSSLSALVLLNHGDWRKYFLTLHCINHWKSVPGFVEFCALAWEA